MYFGRLRLIIKSFLELLLKMSLDENALIYRCLINTKKFRSWMSIIERIAMVIDVLEWVYYVLYVRRNYWKRLIYRIYLNRCFLDKLWGINVFSNISWIRQKKEYYPKNYGYLLWKRKNRSIFYERQNVVGSGKSKVSL